MNDFYFCTSILAHGGIDLSGVSGIFLLIVMSLFVFGPSLFKATIKMPKGLFISSLISYVLILGNILVLSFHLLIPIEVAFLFFAVVYPYISVVGFIGRLTEWRWLVSIYGVVVYLLAFIINTLVIFAIIRLFQYIRQQENRKLNKPSNETENSPVKSADL